MLQHKIVEEHRNAEFPRKSGYIYKTVGRKLTIFIRLLVVAYFVVRAHVKLHLLNDADINRTRRVGSNFLKP